MKIYGKCKKFFIWFMNGMTVLLAIAMMMQMEICGYTAATIFGMFLYLLTLCFWLLLW